jgi:hypothetical protein
LASHALGTPLAQAALRVAVSQHASSTRCSSAWKESKLHWLASVASCARGRPAASSYSHRIHHTLSTVSGATNLRAPAGERLEEAAVAVRAPVRRGAEAAGEVALPRVAAPGRNRSSQPGGSSA